MFFKNETIYIEWHESEIPWIKIFTIEPFRELTDCDESVQNILWSAIKICEKTMRDFYKPHKINIASFGNELQRTHIHIMARFEDDSFFPKPMWGEKQREGKERNFDKKRFEIILINALKSVFY